MSNSITIVFLLIPDSDPGKFEMMRVLMPYCNVYTAQRGKTSRFWHSLNQTKKAAEQAKDIEMAIAEQETKKRKAPSDDEKTDAHASKYQRQPIRFVPKYHSDD